MVTVLGWFVLSVTKSEFALGTTLTFASIPRIVFMLLGGVVADRVDRKRILVTSLLIRALILAFFIFLLFMMKGKPNLWMVDLLAVLFGTIDAFYYPANSSIVPSAVPKSVLDRANSLVQTVQLTSSVLGPLLAAGLLWMRIYQGMFGTIAGLFLVSSVFLSFLRLRNTREVPVHEEQAPQEQALPSGGSSSTSMGAVSRRSSVWRDVHEGIRFVLTVRILVLVMLFPSSLTCSSWDPSTLACQYLLRAWGGRAALMVLTNQGLGWGPCWEGCSLPSCAGFAVGSCGSAAWAS